MNKVVVTYKNADLDCVASAYAYAEYLTKTGTNASYYISGLVQDEVNIVCKLFNILLSNKILNNTLLISRLSIYPLITEPCAALNAAEELFDVRLLITQYCEY